MSPGIAGGASIGRSFQNVLSASFCFRVVNTPVSVGYGLAPEEENLTKKKPKEISHPPSLPPSRHRRCPYWDCCLSKLSPCAPSSVGVAGVGDGRKQRDAVPAGRVVFTLMDRP